MMMMMAMVMVILSLGLMNGWMDGKKRKGKRERTRRRRVSRYWVVRRKEGLLYRWREWRIYE